MNNKESLEIFGQLLAGKQIVIRKSRQIGKSYTSQMYKNWQYTFYRYEKAQLRKESIKKLFNI